jgi:thiol-disulfide isomerase/thioredoxin
MFLLGKGIPEDILNLGEDVLNTPLGKMMAPFIDSMTKNIQSQSPSNIGKTNNPPASLPQIHDSEEHKGAVTEVNSLSELNGLISSKIGLIVDFWSPNCGPCMMFKPTFHKFAGNNKCQGIAFCSVNILINREAASYNGINVIPTFFLYYQVIHYYLLRSIRENCVAVFRELMRGN